jgi:CheY-like chemotaxis protein
LSGLELARLLTTRDPRPYLIAVTGRATPEDIDRGRAAGFDAHLAKPVIPERLAAALSKLKGRE